MSEPQLITSNFDTLSVDRIFIGAAGDLRVMISGVECHVSAKPSMLAVGLVFVEPLDASLAQHWPVYSDLLVNGQRERRWCFAAVPQLLRAAQLNNDALAIGKPFAPGVLKLG